MESDLAAVNPPDNSFLSATPAFIPSSTIWTVYVRIRGPTYIVPKATQELTVGVIPAHNSTFKDVLDILQVTLINPDYWEVEGLRHKSAEDRPRSNLNVPIIEMLKRYHHKINYISVHLIKKRGFYCSLDDPAYSQMHSRRVRSRSVAPRKNKKHARSATNDDSGLMVTVRIRGPKAIVPIWKQSKLVAVYPSRNTTFKQVLDLLEINLENPDDWEIEALRNRKLEDRPRLNINAPVKQVKSYYTRQRNELCFYLVRKHTAEPISDDDIFGDISGDELYGYNNDIQYMDHVAGITVQNVKQEVIHHTPEETTIYTSDTTVVSSYQHTSTMNFGTSYDEYGYPGSYHTHATSFDCLPQNTTTESGECTEMNQEPLTTPWMETDYCPKSKDVHLPGTVEGSGVDLHFERPQEPQNTRRILE